MNWPEGIRMVAVSILLGAFCLYMYSLDKKAKAMQETEEGKREFYDKYTPNYVKKKHKKMRKLKNSYYTQNNLKINRGE